MMLEQLSPLVDSIVDVRCEIAENFLSLMSAPDIRCTLSKLDDHIKLLKKCYYNPSFLHSLYVVDNCIKTTVAEYIEIITQLFAAADSRDIIPGDIDGRNKITTYIAPATMCLYTRSPRYPHGINPVYEQLISRIEIIDAGIVLAKKDLKVKVK